MSEAKGTKSSPEITKTQTSGQSRAGRDLNDAIESVFASQLGATSFADRFCELAFALTNAPSLSLWSKAGLEDTAPQMLGSQGKAVDVDEITNLSDLELEKLVTKRPATVFESGYFIANIAQPDGHIARLIVAIPHGGNAALGLAYERISLLSQLSFSHNRNQEIIEQSELARAAKSVAASEPDGLQMLADALAKSSNADYAAAGLWQSGRLQTLAISGQSGGAKRAQLPAQLNSRLSETARLGVSLPQRLFARAPHGEDGLAMILEKPRRAPNVLTLAGAFYAQADHARATSLELCAAFEVGCCNWNYHWHRVDPNS